MPGKQILVIDDDTDLSYIICDMLENYGYSVTCANDSDTAFSLLTDHTYHVILMDINLPGMSGFEICRELRKVSKVPVLFASARTNENDRITGFDIGGDDYLPKPYSLKELLVRVNALIRRTYDYKEEEEIIRFGNIEVHTASRQVKKNDEVISLSLKEFDLLAFLLENKNAAVSKERLLSGVWGAFTEVEPSTLTVHIRWLREKLEDDPKNPLFIKTVWGIGYMLQTL
ncbi:response regulator transcription factor [Anaerocolumna xylanovorans]|uniref:Stage 0 sporulation protein A homolog n=1 Tax=Anaerocolumna xylanovorans DSM 12503 TaxID=1121345 RepID=A0A1M7YMJ4_9FIRM|nr:response regulator transcription factor [Anaerocolumna xylanovorans]SHO53802.1 two-component system, OmpR family, response regulator VicR [Anaerocolumna xylanovorans DSM 12503]